MRTGWLAASVAKGKNIERNNSSRSVFSLSLSVQPRIPRPLNLLWAVPALLYTSPPAWRCDAFGHTEWERFGRKLISDS